MEPKYGKWFNISFCSNCNKLLSEFQVMYSDGRCPLCGHKGKHAGTIVDHYDRGVRKVTTESHPWWMFWKKDIWHYEMLDESGTAKPWSVGEPPK